jgi:hypothetical protein
MDIFIIREVLKDSHLQQAFAGIDYWEAGSQRMPGTVPGYGCLWNNP